jgi:hypothetical protein
MEIEEEGHLPFLDITICMGMGLIETNKEVNKICY